MLEEVLSYLRNWFIMQNGIHNQEYSIEGGVLTLPFLQDGQYYRIIGSVFNDGVYQYGDGTPLKDETFSGAVWALAIPRAIIKLAEDIAAWQEKNAAVVESPYASESFGGYSYSKNSGVSGENGGISWQSVFAYRLNTWRKV